LTEVLSQSEIDALLAALSSGEMNAEELKKEDNEKKVKVYDFKRALRFSKDQIRSLTRIHENFARLLTTYFSAQLRTFVQFTVASVDQLPYEEFIRSIPKITTLNIFEAPPLEGRMVMELNPNIAYGMLDRLLGGHGNSQSKIGAMTEIETKLIEKIFHKALDTFREAWQSVIDLSPSMEALETNPQFMQIVSPNETVAVISFSTKIGENSGMINLCLPHVVLEPIMPKLSAHYWLANDKKKGQGKEFAQLSEQIKQTHVQLRAILGTSTITISEFLQLSAGDVIQLNETQDTPVVINLDHKPKFIGLPGVVRGKLAVQIQEILKEGMESNDW
jgi:flagellar motor switch protein FliM